MLFLTFNRSIKICKVSQSLLRTSRLAGLALLTLLLESWSFLTLLLTCWQVRRAHPCCFRNGMEKQSTLRFHTVRKRG